MERISLDRRQEVSLEFDTLEGGVSIAFVVGGAEELEQRPGYAGGAVGESDHGLGERRSLPAETAAGRLSFGQQVIATGAGDP